MTKKIVFGAALALVIVGLAAPSASAACNPPKSAASSNTSTGTNAYFVISIANPTTIVGSIWSGAINHTGTCNTASDSNWFYFYAGNVSFNQSLGDACVAGCPSGSLTLQVTVCNALGECESLTSKAIENISGVVQYDFSTTGDIAMGSLRPRTTTSSRTGSNVNLTFGVDAASSFAYGGSAADITGYNIVSASGATDPGPLASAYTFRSFIAATGGTAASGALVVDCSNINNDQWVAVQLVTTAGPSNQVSGRTRVKCDPSLANPKFNVIPKKTMRTGAQN